MVAAVEEAGGEVEDGRVVLARNIAAEGRSRAWVGGAAVPVSALASVAEPLVAVHGQSDQHRLLKQSAQRDALDRFGGRDVAKAAAAYTDLYTRLVDVERELARRRRSAPQERAREADQLRFGLTEIEAVSPEPGEDAALAAEEGRLGFADTLRTAAEQAREALSSEQGSPDALATTSTARTLLEGVREHDPQAGELADRLAEVTYLLSDVAADVASYAARLDTDPARLAAVSERRAALTSLTRKYGETIDEVLAWAEAGSRTAARPRLHRRADRPARVPSRTSLRAAARRGGGQAHRGPAEGGRALGSVVTDELALLAMPHAAVTVDVRAQEVESHDGLTVKRAPGRRPLAAGHRQRRRRGRAPARRQHRGRRPAAAQGRIRW